MGSRKISFEPAARDLEDPGLIVMNVSLCGPHSLETSTLLPTVRDEPGPPPGEAPFCERYWYFAHQVGLCVVLFWAKTWRDETRQKTAKNTILRRRFMSGLLDSDGQSTAGSSFFTSVEERSQATLVWNRRAHTCSCPFADLKCCRRSSLRRRVAVRRGGRSETDSTAGMQKSRRGQRRSLLLRADGPSPST